VGILCGIEGVITSIGSNIKKVYLTALNLLKKWRSTLKEVNSMFFRRNKSPPPLTFYELAQKYVSLQEAIQSPTTGENAARVVPGTDLQIQIQESDTILKELEKQIKEFKFNNSVQLRMVITPIESIIWRLLTKDRAAGPVPKAEISALKKLGSTLIANLPEPVKNIPKAESNQESLVKTGIPERLKRTYDNIFEFEYNLATNQHRVVLQEMASSPAYQKNDDLKARIDERLITQEYVDSLRCINQFIQAYIAPNNKPSIKEFEDAYEKAMNGVKHILDHSDDFSKVLEVMKRENSEVEYLKTHNYKNGDLITPRDIIDLKNLLPILKQLSSDNLRGKSRNGQNRA
jgi:hypothetical protein